MRKSFGLSALVALVSFTYPSYSSPSPAPEPQIGADPTSDFASDLKVGVLLASSPSSASQFSLRRLWDPEKGIQLEDLNGVGDSAFAAAAAAVYFVDPTWISKNIFRSSGTTPPDVSEPVAVDLFLRLEFAIDIDDVSYNEIYPKKGSPILQSTDHTLLGFDTAQYPVSVTGDNWWPVAMQAMFRNMSDYARVANYSVDQNDRLRYETDLLADSSVWEQLTPNYMGKSTLTMFGIQLRAIWLAGIAGSVVTVDVYTSAKDVRTTLLFDNTVQGDVKSPMIISTVTHATTLKPNHDYAVVSITNTGDGGGTVILYDPSEPGQTVEGKRGQGYKMEDVVRDVFYVTRLSSFSGLVLRPL